MSALEDMQAFCAKIGCICFAEESMRAHTTFRIGGPADLFVRPRNRKMASEVIQKARGLKLPVTIVGKGSNLLVSDKGIRGVVISMDEDTAGEPKILEKNLLLCPAGLSLAKLCAFAMKNGLSGLEFAWGIPGSVGGGIYMNAGAYGGEMKNVLFRVEYLDTLGLVHEKDAEEIEMGYRRSWFSRRPGHLITNAIFALRPGDPQKIRQTMEEHMNARKLKQPLDHPSAGSVFKRPPGAYAAELIEQAGLKGRRVGGAMVSSKHAGFIVNFKNATCEDVKTLIGEVKEMVRRCTGYQLECEIQELGEP